MLRPTHEKSIICLCINPCASDAMGINFCLFSCFLYLVCLYSNHYTANLKQLLLSSMVYLKMKKNILESVEINPKLPAKASVIWLHGLGADGHDFVDVIPELKLPEELAVRFIFPHAPIRPVTINQGYQMRAWFDIYALHINAPQDEIGIRETENAIGTLIENEIHRGVACDKIVLAGFSQGGAIALYCGLRYPKKLAGILGLSAFLPLHEKLAQEKSAVNLTTPIMLAHGTQDPIVPIQLGELCRDYLKNLGYQIDWHSYPMQHQVCLQEIDDIARWLKKIID